MTSTSQHSWPFHFLLGFLLCSACGADTTSVDAGIDATNVDARADAGVDATADGDAIPVLDASVDSNMMGADARAIDVAMDSPADVSPPDVGMDAAVGTDVFGLTELYPSLSAGRVWTSEHWNNGNERRFTSARAVDPDDPSAWSTLRGSGSTLAMEIDGSGVMSLRGNQPRLYLTPTGELFQDVEVTFYYRRVSDDETPWGGAIVGMRSGPDNHGSDNCGAHTYYARMRHDGRHDFAKELQHPSSAPVDRASIDPAGLRRDDWIGFKAVVYTRSDGAVVLEHYRDVSGGAAGGTWEMLGTQFVDDGGWSADQTDCGGRPDDHVITERGVVLLRNTMGNAGRADYRWVSVREIAAP